MKQTVAAGGTRGRIGRSQHRIQLTSFANQEGGLANVLSLIVRMYKLYGDAGKR